MRNFTTDDGAAQDLQFDDSMAEQPINVFGWLKVNQSSIAPGATPFDQKIGEVTQTRMVFQDYIDARDYEEPEPEPETEEEPETDDDEDEDEDPEGGDDDNEGGDDDEDDDDDDSNDDGATSVTTYAAALFATVYALAF